MRSLRQFFALVERAVGLFLLILLITPLMLVSLSVGAMLGERSLGVFGALALLGLVLWRWGRSQWRRQKPWWPNIDGENLYSILGISARADAVAMRQAFRRLSQQYHPDRASPAEKPKSLARFIRLNKAYELLSDPEVRYEYDWMIENNGGRIPPFDVTCERLTDVSKHPMFAIYDEWERTQKVIDWEEFEKRLLESPNEPTPTNSATDADRGGGPAEHVPAKAESVDAATTECPACGWPCIRNRSRPEPAYCEQCGEELTKS